MNLRFRHEDASLYRFLDEIVIECPRCEGRALVRAVHYVGKLTCLQCGHNAGPSSTPASICPDGRDPYFHGPLWLRSRCAGHQFWAYNYKHLAWLKSFIGADLRERGGTSTYRSNRSLASRLPRWMKAEKSREEVVRCIERLEKK